MAQTPNAQTGLLFIGQLLIALAIAGTGWLIHTDLQSRPGPKAQAQPSQDAAPQPERQQQPQPTEVEDWKRLVRDHNPTLGPDDAPVTIIEFSDFECPYCSRHFKMSHPKIVDEYGDKVRIVFKHLPLSFHPNAMPAAVAAQCAVEQGKFWPVHDELFEKQRSLSEDTILEIGANLDLGDAWVQCFKNEETREQVKQDLDDAQSVGVRGTPTFLINGKIVPGAVPFQIFRENIEPLL